MKILMLVALVVVAWALVRSLREQRNRWLGKLDLPGTWICDLDGQRYQLDLSGSLAGGRYQESWSEQGHSVKEQGGWAIHGNDIEFSPEGSDSAQGQRCALRLFAPGKIGIDGPGRPRRIYQRRASNVVPLAGRH